MSKFYLKFILFLIVEVLLLANDLGGWFWAPLVIFLFAIVIFPLPSISKDEVLEEVSFAEWRSTLEIKAALTAKKNIGINVFHNISIGFVYVSLDALEDEGLVEKSIRLVSKERADIRGSNKERVYRRSRAGKKIPKKEKSSSIGVLSSSTT